MLVYLSGDTFINDYQIPAYYIIESIASGKKGEMESSISDEDIPKEVGKYSIIESHVNCQKCDE